MANNKNVIIRIKRQNNPESRPYWEEFELDWKPGMNVTSSLMDIAAKPVTRDGKKTTPITYDSNCLEEVCGSCAMLINGHASAAIDPHGAGFAHFFQAVPFVSYGLIRLSRDAGRQEGRVNSL